MKARFVSIYFFLLPFWAFLGYRTEKNFGISYTGIFKDILLVIIIVLAVPKLRLSLRRLGMLQLFLLLYIFYLALELLYSYFISFELFVSGLRYQFSYLMLAAVLVFSQQNGSRLIFDASSKALVTATILCICIGALELLSGSVISFLYGVGSKAEISHTSLVYGERLISTLVNPINFAIFVSMAFFIVVMRMNISKIRFKALFEGVLIVFCCVLVYWTLSRAALFSFLVALVIYYFVYFNFLQKFWLGCVAILGICIVAFTFTYIYTDIHLVNRFASLARYTSVDLKVITENVRVTNWLSSIAELNSLGDFLFGLAPGISNPTDGELGYKIENMYVSVLIESGMVGFTLWFLLLGTIFIKVLKSSLRDKRFAPLIGCYLVYLFAGVFNDLHRNFPFSALFALILYYSHVSCNILSVKALQRTVNH